METKAHLFAFFRLSRTSLPLLIRRIMAMIAYMPTI